MKLAIRLDDISPDMDWKRFNRLVALMDRYGVRPLLSVIPENRDPKVGTDPADPCFWDTMKALEKKGYVLAMHGCYHVYTTKKGGIFPLNYLSEFAGLPAEKQAELISTGSRILKEHGIDTDVFVAPAHSFDRKTLEALRSDGFRFISDGFGFSPFTALGFTWYPISFNRRKTLESAAAGTADNSSAPGDQEEQAVTLVIHPATMTEHEFEEYENIFKTYEMVAYGDFMQMSAKPKSAPAFAMQYLMAAAKRAAALLRR